MKKIILVSLSVVIVMSLVACGKNKDNKIDNTEAITEDNIKNYTESEIIKESNSNLTEIYNVPAKNIAGKKAKI